MGFLSKIKQQRETALVNEERHKDEVRNNLSLIEGMEYINNSQFPTMWAKNDGSVYFDEDYENRYIFIGFEWNGSQYEHYTTSHSESTTKGKEKTKGRILGAAVGTLIAPGVGTVIGAAHGTGNKKISSKTVTDGITKEHKSEIMTPAILTLKSISDGAIIKLTVRCVSSSAERLLKLLQTTDTIATTTDKEGKSNPYEEIKQLKELLDIGAITQEEFDLKKKELLGL